MPDNISKHTLGLTQLQSGQGVPNHNAPKSTFYIDVTSSEFYKNTDGLNNWSLIVGGITGDYLPLSGGTVSGGTYFSNGLSASTVSATTYYNLPTDIYVTGGTYSASVSTIIFTNITGGTFEVTGITATGGGNFTGGTVTGQTIFQSGLTATTISATSLNVDYIDFNTAYTGQTLPVGRLQWDDGNGTLLLGLKGGISNMELGLENMALCFNDDTITLTAGTMVYVSGSQGNRPAIKRALATNDGYSVTTLGMVSESIASGETGFVTTYGMVNNLGTYGLTGGTALWLSPTILGGYTDVKPQAPDHTVLIGYVVRVPNNPGQMVGSVFVNISNGWEIDELHDVRINGRTEGDLLVLDSYSGSPVWVNSKTLKGNYTINGNLVVSASTGVVISGDTSSSMLRITQLGGGNAILVEDSTNPDATPFVVNSDGKIGIGTTSPNYFMEAISSGGTDAIMLFDGGTSANANLVARADTTQKVPSIVLTDRNDSYSINDSFFIALDRTSGASSNLYVNRNDAIYVNNYQDKGHYFITNDGGSKDVRMSISSNGNVGIGVLTATTKLQVSGDTLINGNLSATTISADTIENIQYIDFDITNTGTTSESGRLFWDVNNRTLSVGMVSGVTQQIGQEQYYLVENQTSGILNDGYVVRVVGTTGSSGKILVDYMIANGTIPAFTTLGVLTQPINSGDTGYVTSFGLVRNIDTTGVPYGETWNQGDALYVSPTILGGFTKFKPINPNLDIIIALVMEQGVNGSIFVRPDVYRPFKDPKRIIVDKQNGDFTSIKSAVNSITGSSSSNRYVIDVGPGMFMEGEIDLTSKPYVSIVGSNIQTTLITPTGNTQNIIKIGVNNEISFLSLSGAPSGYAGIYCDDIGDFGQAHKISLYDCDTNLWVKSSSVDTKFYGEYLDFNGTYTYGTRVEATNNYLALANIENYYNFPSGSNIVYCNYATGSGATINSFVGDNVSNGVSGSTAFYIQDGASLNASTITVDGFTYGIRNPNIGQPVRFDVDNASLVDGEWDLHVENQYTFGTFGGSSSHQKIFTVSPDVYWLFLDIGDGELDITRKASVTFSDGTHTDLTTLLFDGSSMGLMSGGSLSIVSGLTVNTSTGFGYLGLTTSTGVYKRIDWVDSQITLSPSGNSYVYINENSTLSSSGTKPNSVNNIILGRVVTNSTGVDFIDPSPFHSDHTSNRFGNLFREALGPIYSFGTVVTENTTPFKLDVTQGEYYYSTNEYLPNGGTGITFTQYYRDGSGGWITSTADTVTNVSYDGNGSLSALTASAYTKHTLYLVGDGSYEKYFLVLGQNEYTSLVQAENALLPTPPTYFNDSVVQIANIYVQQGTTGITQFEDIKPVIGFRAGGVSSSSLHANLLGLNSDDHKQYLLVAGGRAMSGNLDMGGSNNITNVNLVDGVDVSDHKVRHQFNGSDAIGTTTPTANAIPYADVSGTLDSWVSTATTSTLGRVKLSTSPVSASNPIAVGENDLRFTSSFTAVSYSNNVLTFTNVGGTDILRVINTVTGWTVNGNLIVTGTSSASTVTLTSTPTFNNDNTQILTRNSTTGNIEYSDSNSIYIYNYGLSFAMSSGNFLQ